MCVCTRRWINIINLPTIELVGVNQNEEKFCKGFWMRQELKCWPEFFETILDGRKQFELRRNDRNYEVGQEYCIKEWDTSTVSYTGREVNVRITYVLQAHEFPGINPNHCIFSFEII